MNRSHCRCACHITKEYRTSYTAEDASTIRSHPDLDLEMQALYLATRPSIVVHGQHLRLSKIEVTKCPFRNHSGSHVRVHHKYADTGNYHGYRDYKLCLLCLIDRNNPNKLFSNSDF